MLESAVVHVREDDQRQRGLQMGAHVVTVGPDVASSTNPCSSNNRASVRSIGDRIESGTIVAAGVDPCEGG